MDLTKAEEMIRELLVKHELKDWTFIFDSSKKRFGRCGYGTKTINISLILTLLNNEDEVRDTVLHEISHALNPADGHGYKWRETCKRIGCRDTRCYDTTNVIQPPTNNIYVCPNCKKEFKFFKKVTDKLLRSCSKCGNGKFNAKYILRKKDGI